MKFSRQEIDEVFQHLLEVSKGENLEAKNIIIELIDGLRERTLDEIHSYNAEIEQKRERASTLSASLDHLSIMFSANTPVPVPAVESNRRPYIN